MLIKFKKTGKRILSYILVLALSVSLLSGCSQADGNGQAGTEVKHNEAVEKRRKAVQSAGAVLAGQTEETEKLLEELGSTIARQDVDEAASLVGILSGKLEETEKQTENWLEAQQEMTKDLSDGAADVLEKRKNSFEKEIAAGGKETGKILKTLRDAIEKGDMEAARAEAGELEALLADKEEPKTYGDTMPNEVEVQEAGEEEYTEPADSTETGDSQDDTGFGEEIKKAERKNTEEELKPAEEGTKSKSKKARNTVSPEQALLEAEGDTALNDRITAKAEELETPLAVYNYLKNNIGYEYYHGSRKGAADTLDTMGGNDLDQASLLIAMLRHLGYPAKYVKGDILLTEEQALSLTGADTFRHAADVLAAAGTPVTRLTRGEEIVYIRMEHVWVRVYVPYTDYRGAGNAGGESLWIDLDTSIKAYEAVDNIYDTLDEQGFPEAAQTITKGGDTAQIESLLKQWEEKLQAEDLSETYARKWVIKNEEVSYLPLSLQYTVEKESQTFAQVKDSDKDSVSFEINGDVMAGFAASDLQGKDILLSFQPASSTDKEIYDRYSSIFDIPAYAVYMKPVLLVDNEVVAEGEEYLESTLGTRGSFTINLFSGGKNTSVTNDITTGSMYAVTLDKQNITAAELQSVYDEAAGLKDSVAEENVYSEEYLGKMLAFAGKLYFAQVDIADTMAADTYDVSVTRSLSEGITGYEVRTSSLYGRVTSLSEGSLYIDVDTNSHSVVSLNGEEDAPKEYMFSTGIISSLYESTVWEELTGNESVSTVSILNTAREEGIDILLLSSANLDTEIEKLNTDEATKQTVINAVNSGKIVTIPTEDVTMGNWHGTGYIVTNPETGTGAYMISGGLNGGSTTHDVTLAYMVDIGFSIWDMAEAIMLINSAIAAIAVGGAVVGGVFLAFGVVALGFAIYSYFKSMELMLAYASGDEEAGQQLVQDMWINLALGISIAVLRQVAKPIIKTVLKNKLVKEFGEDVISKLLKQFDDVTDLGRYIKQVKKAGISKELIEQFADKYGKEGLDWLFSKKHLGLSDDFLKKVLKAGNLDDFTDDVLNAIKNSDGYADDIIEQIIKHGDDAADAIGKYGDDAAEVIKDYGDDAVEEFSKGKIPEQIKNALIPSKTKQALLDSVQDIRSGIGQSYPAGNVGVAKVDIDKVKENIKAYSKYKNKENFAKQLADEDRIFKTLKVNSDNIVDGANAFNRCVDSESKILEDIAHQLGYTEFKAGEKVSGTIYLITERPPCPSCEGVIKQFREMFPDIKFIVESMY